MSQRRIVLISSAPVGPRMAGPAIRYVQMGRVLRSAADVTLVAPNGGGGTIVDGKQVAAYSDLPRLLAGCDVVVSQGCGPYLPELAGCRALRIFDLYDPVHIESASYFAHETGGQVERIMLLQLRAVLRWGDLFLCTGPRQRDMWLGVMSAERRLLGDWVRRGDPLGCWIEAPFGIETEPPRSETTSVLRGRLPGVTAESFVLLWNGGLWNWLDPLTPVRAVARMAAGSAAGGGVHLVFMGGAASDLELPRMKMARAAVAEARRLGVLDRCVHFLPGWIEYERRGAYLLEADAVVSSGPPGLEHHFAYRTRLLDAVWAGRAVIANPGEAVGERLAEANAALLVPPGDVERLAEAMSRLAAERALCRAMGDHAAALRAEWAWPRVLEGLVRACVSGSPGGANRSGRADRSGERRWYEREWWLIRQIERWESWKRRAERLLGGGKP